MALKRVHLLISGRVQGVFFRAYTREEAQHLGLTGWVKNRYDGKVEAVFEGEEPKLEQMITWCHQGPSYARVVNVEVNWEEYTGEFNSFSIRGW
jgi:acylphosphatase